MKLHQNLVAQSYKHTCWKRVHTWVGGKKSTTASDFRGAIKLEKRWTEYDTVSVRGHRKLRDRGRGQGSIRRSQVIKPVLWAFHLYWKTYLVIMSDLQVTVCQLFPCIHCIKLVVIDYIKWKFRFSNHEFIIFFPSISHKIVKV